jgi:hypothetical protein
MDRHVAQLRRHIILVHTTMLFLFNAALLAEKQQMSIL